VNVSTTSSGSGLGLARDARGFSSLAGGAGLAFALLADLGADFAFLGAGRGEENSSSSSSKASLASLLLLTRLVECGRPGELEE